MKITRRDRIAIGLAVFMAGVASVPLALPAWLHPFDISTILQYYLLPIWFLYDANLPIMTAPYLITLAGALIVLHTVLEGDRRPDWRDLAEYAFLQVVLATIHAGLAYGPLLTKVEGFLVLVLAFILPFLVDRPVFRQTVFWVYLVYGLLMIANGFTFANLV